MLLLTAGPAVHAATGYTITTLHFDTVVGPHDDTHCDVVADLYLPAPATPAPAILTTHGFGGSKNDGSQQAIGRAFAGEGYVVLSYSGLGFGGSGCKITLDDPDWDGKPPVNWLTSWRVPGPLAMAHDWTGSVWTPPATLESA
ncbi:CocE/NonD family hydrolase [Dactylosporangium sp. CA-152071]|uniref:CocE/NonD family hydrolase n=1 Tax=Dactylosporangium sp. CA-152071 TaxID=3239933 RepID=UPI003D8CA5AA